MRTCAKCLCSKNEEDFYFRNKKKNLRSSYCKLCFHIINAETKRKNINNTKIIKTKEYEKNKNSYRNRLYKLNYGISLEDYENLLFKQNGKCDICLGINNNGRHLDVDHCHKSGKIRGLLCNACNRLLSNSKDDTDILKKAIDYLRKNK